MESIRYANIGLLVGIAFTVLGVLLFKDAGEAVVQAIGLIGFFLGLAVLIGLDERNKRRRERDQ